MMRSFFFFFQAEDGIRDKLVTEFRRVLFRSPGFHDVTGGVYKARERIHGAVADAPLLAIPTSWSRIADSNPN